ncbi:MAG: Gfo/Idh/MocA family oxidoreductase [Sphingomonadaceae bacterium]|nr:Gfo/Idh/MocA family oxidoreductase [Sphingomonadaceae bacterium]
MPNDPSSLSRRKFVAAAGAALVAGAAGAGQAQELPSGPAGRPDPSLGSPEPLPLDRQLGFAVVGLGKLALGEIMDAFTAARRAKVTALVSGNRDKALRVAARYGVPESGIYDYANFDRIADDPNVDVVYIVLPNALHRPFAKRAFRAGKHVLCEKPMATNAEDCAAMIAAGRAANRKLMVAYRCQFEPHNLTAMRTLRHGDLGPVRVVTADIGRATDPRDPADQWRLNRALAGSGSLFDIGIYALNAARFLVGEEPVEVRAQLYAPPNDPRFREVEDVVVWTMRFPGGAQFHGSTSYSYGFTNCIQVTCDRGVMVLDPSMEYHAQRLRIRDRVIQWSPIDQFAREMDHFCMAITDNLPIVADGAEGMQDVKLMLAILEAGRTGRTISTDWGYRRAADPATTVPDNLGVA